MAHHVFMHCPEKWLHFEICSLSDSGENVLNQNVWLINH